MLGTVIKNNDLLRYISDIYHEYMPKDKYPICVLKIDVDPILVDVNVHPTKMDIKFSKMDSLVELINKCIAEKLEHITLIPEANVRDNSSLNEVRKQIINVEEDPIKEVEDNKYEEIKLDFEIEEEQDDYEEERSTRIKKMNVIGNIFMTYIICENEDGMYLVDQHAAAERINYEKFLNQTLNDKASIIDLLTPIKIELSHDEFIRVRERIDVFDELGISVEEFGDNTFIVRSHPSWIKDDISTGEIQNIFELVAEKGNFDRKKFIDSTIISIACHSSVKAHEFLSHEDMQWIVDNVRYCDNPFTCPHGRPTIITYTKDELDKMFKRDYNE